MCATYRHPLAVSRTPIFLPSLPLSGPALLVSPPFPFKTHACCPVRPTAFLPLSRCRPSSTNPASTRPLISLVLPPLAQPVSLPLPALLTTRPLEQSSNPGRDYTAQPRLCRPILPRPPSAKQTDKDGCRSLPAGRRTTDKEPSSVLGSFRALPSPILPRCVRSSSSSGDDKPRSCPTTIALAFGLS